MVNEFESTSSTHTNQHELHCQAFKRNMGPNQMFQRRH